MTYSDTVKLLRECDAGVKMGISSIDDILEKIKDARLKALLQESREHHEKLSNVISDSLDAHNTEEKEPSAMAKGMSWMKTNMKLGMDNSDSTIADLMIDGCDMGVKSLYRYLNQYKAVDDEAKDICKKLIQIEDELRRELVKYL